MEYYEEDDEYSEMFYEYSPFENDEDYEERMQDLDDLLDYYND